MLPVLILACIGAIQFWRHGRGVKILLAEQEVLESMESDRLSSADALPYYRSADNKPYLAVPERSDGFFSRVRFLVADCFMTHFAIAGVLGAVALGGIAVTSVLSRLKFASVWIILVGIALFLVYLVFVGIVIVTINRVSEQILRRMGKYKE